jgi:hypothetical protein
VSWYLATRKKLIDQFATGGGFVALKSAASSYQTLADFFSDGETRNVPTCIAQLTALAKSEKDEDVKSTAEGLARLLAGQSEVFITQGFGASEDSVKESDFDEAIDLAIMTIDTLESLRHPKHAAALEPIRADAKAVLQKFFARQYKELAKEIKPKLEALASLAESQAMQPGIRHIREADATDAVKDAMPDGGIPLALTSGMSVDYSKALTAAMTAGFDVLAAENEAESEIAQDVVEEYLRDHSLAKLTGDFEPTTVQRLQNALADAYRNGADYEGLLQAVKDEYDGFSSVRAGMIAQTEMNNAYNAGRAALADSLDFDEKSWSCDGPNPCLICLENQAMGWIPIEDSFPSGDDIPTAHPGCFCSADFRLAEREKQASS